MIFRFLCVLAIAMSLSAQTPEFVADPMPTPACHASTFAELANGDLLASWFGGTREGAPDVAIWMARRTASGWEKPIEMVREPEIATYNPVLFNGGGLFWLYYKFGPHPSEWTAGRRLSRDQGKTWGPIEHLGAGLIGPVRAKPITLKDGTILAGSSVESYSSWACWVLRSADHGVTWRSVGPIAAGPDLKTQGAAPAKSSASSGNIQPSLVDLGNGHVRMYMRATKDIARICQADSTDNGATWGPVKKTELPNNNSGIDAVRLRDGRQIMVYNDTTEGRTPLSLAASKDGEHWTKLRDLETGPGEFSYPAMIEARNGDLLITYTWRREKIRFVRVPVSDVR